MLIDETQAFPFARREQLDRILGDGPAMCHVAAELTVRTRFRLQFRVVARRIAAFDGILSAAS
jgi:hypothetical protein